MEYTRTFAYELPSKIEFGIGVAGNTADRLKEWGGSRALLVTDPDLLEIGVTEAVTSSLEKAGVPYVLFSEIEPDPEASGVVAGIEKARSEGCDSVIGIGGGSALDSAKAIAIMLQNEGHIRDYAGQNLIPNRGVPMIALPTTAGTGSEVTIWSVISEKEQGLKYGVGGSYMTSTLALCDPELTVTLPAHLTASTGMDALAHALESYVNTATQPISEALSIRAMKLISGSLRRAVANGNDLQARSDMLLGSTTGAMAFNPTRLGLAHSLAMPLGSHYKIPHAVITATLLPEVMRFNLISNLEKFAEIARIFGKDTAGLTTREAAQESVVAIQELYEDIQLPGFSGYGIKDEELGVVAEEAMPSGNTPVNPRKPTVDDLVEIVRAAMNESGTPAEAFENQQRPRVPADNSAGYRGER